ncbi:MAG: carboxypeptidase-like regulatory domain-containing protein [Sphingobacterium sp.]|nr:carboxypeptidase-like regulatory domain-containing protein [Sphingobacterium sp.]
MYSISVLINIIGISSMTLFGACKKDSSASIGQPSEQNQFKVTGLVKDSKNRPFINAKVRVVNHVLYDTSFDVFTGGDGIYITPKLDLGGWNIYAWADIDYEGQTFHLRVAPEDGDYNAFSLDKAGKVKNFKLQLKGRINDVPLSENNPGAGYYGGTLLFTNLPSEGAKAMTAGTTVKITLTPVAGNKYIDGSDPQITEKEFTIQTGQTSYSITDIPQCKYVITAKSGNKTVLLTDYRDIWTTTPYKTSLTYFFKPESAGYNGGLKTNVSTPFYMELQ